MARVESGEVIPLPEFWRRCQRLVARGLSARVASELSESGSPTLLRQVEAASDADLRRLNVVAEQVRT